MKLIQESELLNEGFLKNVFTKMKDYNDRKMEELRKQAKKLPSNPKKIEVPYESQIIDLSEEAKLLAYTKKLGIGIYKDLLPNNNKIFAYERKLDNELLLVVSNFSKKEIKVK